MDDFIDNDIEYDTPYDRLDRQLKQRQAQAKNMGEGSYMDHAMWG